MSFILALPPVGSGVLTVIVLFIAVIFYNNKLLSLYSRVTKFCNHFKTPFLSGLLELNCRKNDVGYFAFTRSA